MTDLRQGLLVHRSERLDGEHLDQPVDPLELVPPALVGLRLDAERRIEIAPLDLRIVGQGEERVARRDPALTAADRIQPREVLLEPFVRDRRQRLGKRRRASAHLLAPPVGGIGAAQPMRVDAAQRGGQQGEAARRHLCIRVWRRREQRLGESPDARGRSHGEMRGALEEVLQAAQRPPERGHQTRQRVLGLSGHLLQVIEIVASGGLSERGGRSFLERLAVERAEHLDGFRRALVRDVVHEIAHRPPVQIRQRLRPAHVAMVDLAEQLLRALLNSVETGRDLEQDRLLLRNHHVDGRAAEIDLERLGLHLRRPHRGAAAVIHRLAGAFDPLIGTGGVPHEIRLVRIALHEPRADRRRRPECGARIRLVPLRSGISRGGRASALRRASERGRLGCDNAPRPGIEYNRPPCTRRTPSRAVPPPGRWNRRVAATSDECALRQTPWRKQLPQAAGTPLALGPAAIKGG